MKKRFFVLVLVVLCSLGLTACPSSKPPKELYFAEIFGVDLPGNMSLDNFKRLYTVNTQGGFHGDGEHYAVFELKQSPVEAFKEYDSTASAEFCENHMAWLDCKIDRLNIPAEYRPDWTQEYKWKNYEPLSGGNDNLYLIFEPYSLRLIMFVRLV